MTPKKKSTKAKEDDRSVRLLRVTKTAEDKKNSASNIYIPDIVDEAERIIDKNAKKRNMPSFIRADTTALSHTDAKHFR